MFTDVETLNKFILESGLVSKKDLDEASLESGAKNIGVDQVLLNSGKISENDMNYIKSQVWGIKTISLKDTKIDFSILTMIPEPIARKHNIVAFKKYKDTLEVAMLDPGDLRAIEFIRKKTQLKIIPYLTDKESMVAVLLQYQKSLKAEFGDIISKEAKALDMSYVPGAEGEADSQNADDLKKLAEDLPVVRIVDTLLNHAIIQQASDIHIEVYEQEVVVRYRIDGILHDAMTLPKSIAPGLSARIKVLSKLRLDEKRLPQDGRFKITTSDVMGEHAVSFRVSILPTYFGEKIVMRLLPDTVRGFTLESLGFHGDGLDKLHRAINQTVGMILVTGPTGSGKSTTLYTLLDILNTPDVNISTVEDPIEYQMARINQMQVKPEIGLTFANGLRSLLRQDPDVIMVGEIRDRETAGLAINAALTGHQVLSTLHTNSAAGAVPRLIDMGAEKFLLVSTINLIMAQRLVRKLHEKKEKYFLSEAELLDLSSKADMAKVLAELKEEKMIAPNAKWKDVPFYRPVPTDDAKDGYSSRIAIHEILRVSPAIKDLVMSGATADAIEEQARKEGMLTLIEDGVFKAAEGITTIEEVLRVANE
jgi:type IV pilus assembly protein PilB